MAQVRIPSDRPPTPPDRHTLQLALRIVPVQWWAARLGDAHLGS